MNIDLLTRVRDHILERPRRFTMGHWIQRKTEHTRRYVGDDGRLERFAPCGTAACIAGWACVLENDADTRFHNLSSSKRGRELLGLNAGQATELFFVSDWPRHYRQAFLKSRGMAERALIASRRINAFIREYKRST